jgi:predicted NUDIX family NTP pyrophosphohydrolase
LRYWAFGTEIGFETVFALAISVDGAAVPVGVRGAGGGRLVYVYEKGSEDVDVAGAQSEPCESVVA